MLVNILNRRWRVKLVDMEEGVDGECDDPQTKHKEIRLSKDLQGMELLDAIIHESLHAAGWHIDEEFVAQFSEDTARLAYKLGFRHEHEKDGEHVQDK